VQTGSRFLASFGMTINGPFHKYFQHIAKNLASGWQLVRVEGSSKSVRGPFNQEHAEERLKPMGEELVRRCGPPRWWSGRTAC